MAIEILMEQLAKSRPSLLRGGIPGYHPELGCKIVDEGDRVSTGLGRYRRCECTGLFRCHLASDIAHLFADVVMSGAGRGGLELGAHGSLGDTWWALAANDPVKSKSLIVMHSDTPPLIDDAFVVEMDMGEPPVSVFKAKAGSQRSPEWRHYPSRRPGWRAEGPIENADDLQPALQRAVAQVKTGKPALVDAVTPAPMRPKIPLPKKPGADNTD